MNKFLSLKYRLLFSYILLSVFICAVFITVFKFSEDYIEEELIYPRLNYELNRFKSNDHINLTHAPLGITFYSDNDSPEELKNLLPKKHIQEVMLDGKEVIVIVQNIDNKRFIIVDDQSTFERIESIILIVLLLASFFAIATAWLFSQFSVSRVIAPLSLLAEKVKANVEPLDFDIKSNDEIGVLAHAIEERDERLHKFLERERLFSSDVSHELRTPLTIILGAAEVLSRNLSQQPKLLVTANRIKKTAVDTSDQVSALLMLSRSPDSLSFSSISMHELIKHELDECITLLEDKPIKLNLIVEDEVHINSQPALITIVIRNLLINACQHTLDGSISVTLKKDKFIIEDTGCGMSQDSKVLLFERSNKNSQTGYGFGLSIVKRIIDYLGWDIEYQKSEVEGSRFIIYFFK